MLKKSIADLARTIRSKNAGSFMITMEIIFDDWDIYTRVKNSGAITRESVAECYDITPESVIDFMYYDAGMGIKANLRRNTPSGGPGESDVYGCQQYTPLYSLLIPWDEQ